jgi:hypothetical protein
VLLVNESSETFVSSHGGISGRFGSSNSSTVLGFSFTDDLLCFILDAQGSSSRCFEEFLFVNSTLVSNSSFSKDGLEAFYALGLVSVSACFDTFGVSDVTGFSAIGGSRFPLLTSEVCEGFLSLVSFLCAEMSRFRVGSLHGWSIFIFSSSVGLCFFQGRGTELLISDSSEVNSNKFFTVLSQFIWSSDVILNISTEIFPSGTGCKRALEVVVGTDVFGFGGGFSGTFSSNSNSEGGDGEDCSHINNYREF